MYVALSVIKSKYAVTFVAVKFWNEDVKFISHLFNSVIGVRNDRMKDRAKSNLRSSRFR